MKLVIRFNLGFLWTVEEESVIISDYLRPNFSCDRTSLFLTLITYV